MKKLIFLTLCCLIGVARAQDSGQAYIEKYKDLAIEQMNQHGIPASVILAVAMHESANGNSKIARNLNNHFGIKGKNYVKTIRSAYKSYDSVEASYADFIRIMKVKPAFNKLFTRYKAFEYKGWVYGIQKGGYAHSKTWGSQVMGTIRKYKLYQFDLRPTVLIDSADVSVVAEEVPILATPAVRIYTVKKGDTLSGIAKKLGTTVSNLKQKNRLKSTLLKPGQKLKY
jgi:LysM repeat protein